MDKISMDKISILLCEVWTRQTCYRASACTLGAYLLNCSISLLPDSHCLYIFDQRSDVFTTCVTFHVYVRYFAAWQQLSLYL